MLYDVLCIIGVICAAVFAWVALVSLASLVMRVDEKSHLLAAGIIPPAAAGIAVLMGSLAFTGISALASHPDMPLSDAMAWLFWIASFTLYAAVARYLLAGADRRLAGKGKPPCPRSVRLFILLSSVLALPALFLLEAGLCMLPFAVSGRIY